MILFMVQNSAVKVEGRYRIPRQYPTEAADAITDQNVRFISWNEADYCPDAKTTLQITDINILKQAVYHAVQQDEAVCGAMITQFRDQYGIDIHALWNAVDDPVYHIIGDVFAQWAHPMIGNMMVSSGIRPQTSGDQYAKNWNSFPSNHMEKGTKEAIRKLISDTMSFPPGSEAVSAAGLRRLTKSSRDQVRCCKDMTELARSIIGEITTYASKKLEKIYALELCNSDRLFAAQKAFIKCVVFAESEEAAVNPHLKEIFYLKDKPISVTEYFYFYFPKLNKLQKDDQWIAFVCLINAYLEGDVQLPCDKPTKAAAAHIASSVEAYQKFPPVIRGAMIINAIRKFKKLPNKDRYSLQLTDESEKTWEIVAAPQSSFIPTLSKRGSNAKIFLWNWTRDEMHAVTACYRKCLLPLWAGPSGHTAGLLDFYSEEFHIDLFTFEGRATPISLVILPTMFAFWRLYYDKRISAVHTLAETFEGALSHAAASQETGYPTAQINAEAAAVCTPDLLTYGEVFETIRLLPDSSKGVYNYTGVMHPVRIMAQVRVKYYNTLPEECAIKRIDALDGVINGLRSALTEKGFEVPRWAQPIEWPPDDGTMAESRGDSSGTGGVEIRNFAFLNVKVFGLQAVLHQTARRNLMGNRNTALSMPALKLRLLFDKLCQCAVSGADYAFTDDFSELPECYIDVRREPFLAGLHFCAIRDCSMAEESFTYRASLKTDTLFWKSVKELTPLADSEEIFCTITETSAGLRFAGEIAVECECRVADKLSLAVHKVSIESGLDDVSCFPYIGIAATIADQFDLMITISPDGGRIYISGEYEAGRVLTIADLLSLFGLDGVIQGSGLLPDKESVFGSLGLRSVSAAVDTVSEGITRIGFTVTAEKPWSIFGDKITLQPYFEMKIEYPFDGKKRKVDCSVLGKWHIGSTVFDLMYSSDQRIYACLAEDSTLRFADVAALFAGNVKFPPVELTDMTLDADVASGNYSLYLSAEHVLEFDVGERKLGIEGLSLTLDFKDGSFRVIRPGGAFALGGVPLTLNGSYDADGNLTFEAMAYADEDYSLGDFVVQTAQDLGQTFDKESLPDALLSVNIRMLTASYESLTRAFHGCVDLENVLVISDAFAIREMTLEISSAEGADTTFQVIARIHICGTEVLLAVSREKEGFLLSGEAEFTNLTFGNIAEEFGIAVEQLPDFITEFAITSLSMKYNFTTKEFALRLSTSAGTLSAEITAGEQSGWHITYETAPEVSVDMLQMPLVGELVQRLSPGTADLSVKDFVLEASPAEGIVFRCITFGSACELELYKPARQLMKAVGTSAPETVKWIPLNKTFAILSVSKVGIGLDGSRVAMLLDASLAVSPFTFSLAQAGVGINIARLSDVAFYLSGFGVTFDNGALAISGSFSRQRREEKDIYAGSLLLKHSGLAVTAVGEYSSGSLFACVALSASIGGPPAFFVTGLALGFGYNRKLTLPPVEKVPEYPLIKAVKKGFDAQTRNELNGYITEEGGQNFLTVGVRFTSFKIVDGFLLLSASFGKSLQIGVLGVADISMPPNAPSHPVARAQLAIKAEYDSSAGVFGAQARLTSESYILSKNCKLTGGFAAFFWFEGSEHSGDFVITLGGYHPAYQKPAHYPDVPRLGLNWHVSSHIDITGEIYFSLTPSAVMAGGKLSAVYTLGKLRAWFIAYADFLVSWRPFSYQAKIGVSLGASYRVDVWFIHKTFSVELAAELALWGPEVQGRLHVSWFIISFTISFSDGADHSGDSLDWGAFKEAFLLNEGKARMLRADKGTPAGDTDILAVTVTGVCGQTADGTDIVNPTAFDITLVSRIPEKGNVRPVNNAELASEIMLTVKDEQGGTIDDLFRQHDVTRNVPAALWKSAPAPQDRLREESTVKDARCGVSYELLSEVRTQELFPKTRYISLEELYLNNTLIYEDCFRFVPDQPLQLSDEDSIRRFSQSADSEETRSRRQKYLADNGITEQVSIAQFAADAENWLSEELLIIK